MSTINRSEQSFTIKGRLGDDTSYSENLGYTQVDFDFIRVMQKIADSQNITLDQLITALNSATGLNIQAVGNYLQIQVRKANALANGAYAISGIINGQYLTTSYRTDGTIRRD